MLQILQWTPCPGNAGCSSPPSTSSSWARCSPRFPDATVVVTHRDPVSVVQSAATMMTYAARMSYRTPEPDFYLAYWTDRIRRLLEASLRDRHLVPADRPGRRALPRVHGRRRWPPSQRIYTMAGLAMTDEARAQIGAYLAGHPRGKEGQVDLRPASRLRRRTRRGPRRTSASTTTPWRCAEEVPVSAVTPRTSTGSSTSGPARSCSPRSTTIRPIRVTDFLYRSGGTTAAYMLVTGAGRVIVNTGMGYEAPHHKRVFDAVCPGPTPYIVTTQAHVDHVGGVGLFREPGTRYVAQANNQACQHDDQRIAALRLRTAAIWFDISGRRAREIAAENPGVPMRQDTTGPRRHLRSTASGSRSAASSWSSWPRRAARPSTAAWCGSRSTASA